MTSTTFPVKYADISSTSTSTSSLSKRSSTWTSRISLTLILPLIRSANPGTVCTLTPGTSQHAINSPKRLPLREGIAITISSIGFSSAILRISSLPPKTSTPWILIPFFRGSSSIKPTGEYPSPRFLLISLTTCSPASPAPTTNTFFIPEGLEPPYSLLNLMTILLPPMRRIFNIHSKAMIERGTFRGMSKSGPSR